VSTGAARGIEAGMIELLAHPGRAPPATQPKEAQ
jgi:hypothetical protein